MNIIKFVEDPALIGDKDLSPAQKMTLKSIYGESLNKKELKIFKQCTGLKKYKPREWHEVTICVGRRSGKSSKLATYTALYEACVREHKPAVGEIPVVMIVASEKRKQARITFDYCLGTLRNSPMLGRMIENVTQEEILLSNGVSIRCYPCSIAKIRGTSLVAFIGEECCFWKSADGLQDIDELVLDAARPGLSFPNSKMIKISSPWYEKGEVYNDVKKYWGVPNKDVLVIRGDSLLFNPSLKDWASRLKRRSSVSYETEVMGGFRKFADGMFDPEILEQSIDYDRPKELPFDPAVENMGGYVNSLDAAGGGGRDHYALCIGHLSEDNRIVIDLIRSQKPPFSPTEVTGRYCQILKSYSQYEVCGDVWAKDWVIDECFKHDLYFKHIGKTKAELYLEALAAFNTGMVSMPEDELTLSQLKRLIRKPRSSGREMIDLPSGEPEDRANVLCAVIYLLQQRANLPEMKIEWLG